MIGKLLGLPFRIANAPIRAFEKFVGKACGQEDIREGERILSVPLDCVAKALEEIDKESKDA